MERHRKIQRHKKGKVTADKQRQREKEEREIGKAKDKETKMTAKSERHRK